LSKLFFVTLITFTNIKIRCGVPSLLQIAELFPSNGTEIKGGSLYFIGEKPAARMFPNGVLTAQGISHASNSVLLAPRRLLRRYAVLSLDGRKQ
jgi:hypothetical protein